MISTTALYVARPSRRKSDDGTVAVRRERIKRNRKRMNTRPFSTLSNTMGGSVFVAQTDIRTICRF